MVEVLFAIALVSIGLVGLATALVPTGGVSNAMTSGNLSVTRGYFVTIATILAQDRLEQIKRLQYTIGPPAVDQLTAPTPAGFESEAFGTISGYPAFSRQVVVTAATPTATSKTVTVTVQYRVPNAAGGVTQNSVALTTIIAARP